MADDDFFARMRSSFSEKIRSLRNGRGMSARELSLALGQNVNYINLIENGRRMPSLEGFFLICEYFGLTPASFFAQDAAAEARGRTPGETPGISATIARMSGEQVAMLDSFLKSVL